jgi:hypothetical protein
MNNILVSVLLPTRARTKLVHRSVASVLSKSVDPTQIEIITAYDEDDQTMAYVIIGGAVLVMLILLILLLNLTYLFQNLVSRALEGTELVIFFWKIGGRCERNKLNITRFLPKKRE